MFKWYAGSAICHAILAEVGGEDGNTTQTRESRWFRRGSTLPKLIAPPRVKFYDKDWNFLGTRVGLSVEIQQITRTARDFPNHTAEDVEELLATIPVGCRVSWAA